MTTTLHACLRRWPHAAWLLPAGLVLLALALRLWMAGAAPLHADELHYVHDYMSPAETAGLHAIRSLDCAMLAERRTAHPMLVPLLTRWLWFLPLGWAVEWTPGFWRGFNVIAGALLVVPAWLAGWLIGGRRQAVLAAFLAATGPGLVWTSRTAYLDPVYTLFVAGWLAAVAWGWRGGALRAAALQGCLFGLVLATKISAPLLVPAFLAGLLLAPPGTATAARVQRAALGGAIAILLWVLLCDPASYWHAIVQPTDMRYTDTWDREGIGGTLNLLFVHLGYFLSALLWDAPLTAPALAAAALLVCTPARRVPALFLLLVLLCLAPLLLLHHPRLSGSHGFMPLHLVLALLASHAAPLPRRWLLTGVVAHALLSLTSLALLPVRQVPLRAEIHPALQTDERHNLLRTWVHRRDPSPGIVLVDIPGGMAGWTASIRNAQLAEGAIVLVPCDEESTPGTGLWQWADVVVVHESLIDSLLPAPPDFVREEHSGDPDYTLHLRVAGQARRDITLGELPGFPDRTSGPWTLCLPGDIHVLSGRWSHGGEWVADPSGNSPFFAGPFQFNPPPGEDPSGLRLTLHPPLRQDVLWGF